MPPIVRLALWWRLVSTNWQCPDCLRWWIGGYGGHHIMQSHPQSRRAKASWILWFDACVASMWT